MFKIVLIILALIGDRATTKVIQELPQNPREKRIDECHDIKPGRSVS
jgi:hypothetical protein